MCELPQPQRDAVIVRQALHQTEQAVSGLQEAESALLSSDGQFNRQACWVGSIIRDAAKLSDDLRGLLGRHPFC